MIEIHEKISPGNWEYDADDNVIMGADGEYPLGKTYCNVYFPFLSEEEEIKIDEEAKYNGILWAASKEMLELLLEVYNKITKPMLGDTYDKINDFLLKLNDDSQ